MSVYVLIFLKKAWIKKEKKKKLNVKLRTSQMDMKSNTLVI